MGLAEPEAAALLVAARRCSRLEMRMETAVVHAHFTRHVPKPTRRGCGSAKLYPPEKALHERRDSNCSHGESAQSTSGPWLISATKLLHPIACTHPASRYSRLSLLLSAWYEVTGIAVRKKSVLRVCLSCLHAIPVGQMAHITSSSIVWK